jgi:hypothetical protein
MRWSTSCKVGAAMAASAVTMVVASAAPGVFAADHLDAPGLKNPDGRPDADINDVYVFPDGGSRTVVAMTTHPGVGALSPSEYATNVLYKINVDTTGDAVEDQAYVYRFSPKRAGGHQLYTVTRYTGSGARTLRDGTVVAGDRTGRSASTRGAVAGGRSFAGLRSDPFFFDLAAFRGTVLGQDTGRTICDGKQADFFRDLNTNAVVLSLPNAALAPSINVWATTLSGNGNQIDRMGRPAINAVFNDGEAKNRFNRTQPSDDRLITTGAITGALRKFSGLDAEKAYTESELDTLAGVLLPDVLAYDRTKPVAGPLNGRALADDVIDAELNIVTGGFAFSGRDAKGAIPGDCVATHTDYRTTFPFLGMPHS